MIRPKGLGRGLDALLAGNDEASSSPETLQTLSVDRLRPGKYQPRAKMDAASLAELALSIKEQGVMQPILVRPVDGGVFEIVAGERRWRAAQQAGLREIPALVKNVPDQAALAVRLIDEFGLTHEAAAKAVGRSRSAVSNLLRLNGLAPPVQEYLLTGQIEMGHARALLALPVAQQSGSAARVVSDALTVRDTERLVHALLNPAAVAPRRNARRPLDTDTTRLANDLGERLGAVVHIEPGRRGGGRVVIRYASLDQLDGIIERLGAPVKSAA
jgi:ParB family transcriptional regulator, chromosome partitioning protein